MKFESHVSKILKPETFFVLLLVFFFEAKGASMTETETKNHFLSSYFGVN